MWPPSGMKAWIAYLLAVIAASACTSPKYRTEPVEFRNGPVTLAGTLYLPPEGSLHPGVVIVHGSGSSTRATYAPLAEEFAARGIAALIYDKRGTGDSGGNWQTSPFAALGEDAAAGIAYLRLRPEIAPGRVGIWGGSEGGWIAPRVAARDSQVAFVIVQSAPVVTAARQHTFQVEQLIRARGGSPGDVERAREYVRAQHAYAATREGWEAYERMREENRSTMLAVLGGPDSPDDWWWNWWGSKMSLDPSWAWERVRVPVLALWGDRDELVPVSASREALDVALRRGGNDDAELEVVRNATHDLEPLGVRKLLTVVERVARRNPGVTPSMKHMAGWASRRFAETPGSSR